MQVAWLERDEKGGYPDDARRRCLLHIDQARQVRAAFARDRPYQTLKNTSFLDAVKTTFVDLYLSWNDHFKLKVALPDMIFQTYCEWRTVNADVAKSIETESTTYRANPSDYLAQWEKDMEKTILDWNRMENRKETFGSELFGDSTFTLYMNNLLDRTCVVLGVAPGIEERARQEKEHAEREKDKTETSRKARKKQKKKKKKEERAKVLHTENVFETYRYRVRIGAQVFFWYWYELELDKMHPSRDFATDYPRFDVRFYKRCRTRLYNVTNKRCLTFKVDDTFNRHYRNHMYALLEPMGGFMYNLREKGQHRINDACPQILIVVLENLKHGTADVAMQRSEQLTKIGDMDQHAVWDGKDCYIRDVFGLSCFLHMFAYMMTYKETNGRMTSVPFLNQYLTLPDRVHLIRERVANPLRWKRPPVPYRPLIAVSAGRVRVHHKDRWYPCRSIEEALIRWLYIVKHDYKYLLEKDMSVQTLADEIIPEEEEEEEKKEERKQVREEVVHSSSGSDSDTHMRSST